MTTNKPYGENARKGPVILSSQTLNSKTGQWTQRDSETERFMDCKKGGTPFKGVIKEK
jgi:hypothetical protein